jgi:flagellar assembly factor FliW
MTTVNMKSPIILNKEHKIAAQVILPLNYQFKLPIYAAQSANKGGE